jgi:hypothetical protein
LALYAEHSKEKLAHSWKISDYFIPADRNVSFIIVIFRNEPVAMVGGVLGAGPIGYEAVEAIGDLVEDGFADSSANSGSRYNDSSGYADGNYNGDDSDGGLGGGCGDNGDWSGSVAG